MNKGPYRDTILFVWIIKTKKMLPNIFVSNYYDIYLREINMISG